MDPRSRPRVNETSFLRGNLSRMTFSDGLFPMFRLKKTSNKNKARAGLLRTSRGVINTPFFMPIATKAAVKGVTSAEMKTLGAQILLSNTYHLMLRPGEKNIEKLGGLHKFMDWDGPILTDSGGYQVFSLGKTRKIERGGIRFQSHLDGKSYYLTPKKAIAIQQALGSDIMMMLDECVAYPSTREYIASSVELTTRWAKESKNYYSSRPKAEKSNPREFSLRSNSKRQLAFGIIQGGVYKDLRLKSLKDLVDLNFDGYAIGGLSVGEPAEKRWQVVAWVAPELPKDKPRYMMGVGKPEEILEAVRWGIDMFDCVLPTRNARHGTVYVDLSLSEVKRRIQSKSFKTLPKQGKLYSVVHIKNVKHQLDKSPLDKDCDCPVCTGSYSRAYLRHLFLSEDPLAQRLLTIHNVRFYLRLMEGIRQTI